MHSLSTLRRLAARGGRTLRAFSPHSRFFCESAAGNETGLVASALSTGTTVATGYMLSNYCDVGELPFYFENPSSFLATQATLQCLASSKLPAAVPAGGRQGSRASTGAAADSSPVWGGGRGKAEPVGAGGVEWGGARTHFSHFWEASRCLCGSCQKFTSLLLWFSLGQFGLHLLHMTGAGLSGGWWGGVCACASFTPSVTATTTAENVFRRRGLATAVCVCVSLSLYVLCVCSCFGSCGFWVAFLVGCTPAWCVWIWVLLCFVGGEGRDWDVFLFSKRHVWLE